MRRLSRGADWRLGSYGIVAVLALTFFAACASTSTTTTGQPTPGPFARGTWVRPAFPTTSQPTVSIVGFADGDQRVGYACAATLMTSTPTATGTPSTATPTPVNTTIPAATATPGQPGVPTGAVVSALLRTNDGGLTWQAATLPSSGTGLLCPISAIVAPDVADPLDVFFLAAFGDLNLQDPASIAPGQVRFELWRSQDGAQTWTQLALPVAPNPINPVVLSPYHLIINVHGQTLVLGSNYSGQNFLFRSTNGGKTWQQITGIPLKSGTVTQPARLTFAGFAQGANGALLALVDSPGAQSSGAYEIYQSNDSAQTWKLLARPTLTLPSGATAQAQLFAAPGGSTLFMLVRSVTDTTTPATPTAAATPDATPTSASGVQVTSLRSTDNGATWTTLPWPTETGTTTTPVGSVNIATLGTEFAVDARGDAFMAPTNSDLPPQQDANGPLSAGFFEAPISTTAWSAVASPLVAQNTAFTLAVSLVPTGAISGTPTGTGTPSGTGTPGTAPIGPETPVPGTPGATATSTAAPAGTPTPLPGSDGLPTLWTNFGPLGQFTSAPDSAGFFLNVLP